MSRKHCLLNMKHNVKRDTYMLKLSSVLTLFKCDLYLDLNKALFLVCTRPIMTSIFFTEGLCVSPR